jgi:hypothetical protein
VAAQDDIMACVVQGGSGGAGSFAATYRSLEREPEKCFLLCLSSNPNGLAWAGWPSP